MATTTKFTAPESPISIFTTELNSLANSTSESTGKVLYSSNVDNLSGLYLFCDLELNLGTFGSAPSAGAAVEVFFLYSTDDTNYCDGSTTVDPPSSAWVGSFPIRAATAAQRIILTGIPIFPGQFKVLLRNKTGQTFNASGNTLKLARYYLQGV